MWQAGPPASPMLSSWTLAEPPTGHAWAGSLTARMWTFLSRGLKKPDVLGGAGGVAVAVDASVCV